MVASGLLYAVVCLENSITADDRNGINKLIKKAGSMNGFTPDSFGTVLEIRTRRTILEYDGHPLHDTHDGLWSVFSDRLLMPKSSSERLRKIFVPLAVQLISIK